MAKIGKFIKKTFKRKKDYKDLQLTHDMIHRLNRLERIISSIHQVQVDNYVDRILSEPRYKDPLRLHSSGFKGTSQFDEDGILQEILRRIGEKHRTFVEFGVGDGFENNTLYLLHQGWRGLWMEFKDEFACQIRDVFSSAIDDGTLTFRQDFLTTDNINAVIGSAGFQGEIDVLSIDVDGNDYHLWKAVDVINPRVVVIEYNVKFRPPVKWIMKYNQDHRFDKTDYCGASLQSLEILGRSKGYSLVGCGLTGANAFFVRDDLAGDQFKQPYSAENHYEPCRYPLAWRYRSGMGSSFGPTEEDT